MKCLIPISGSSLLTKCGAQFWQNLHDFIAYILANLCFILSFIFLFSFTLIFSLASDCTNMKH